MKIINKKIQILGGDHILIAVCKHSKQFFVSTSDGIFTYSLAEMAVLYGITDLNQIDNKVIY